MTGEAVPRAGRGPSRHRRWSLRRRGVGRGPWLRRSGGTFARGTADVNFPGRRDAPSPGPMLHGDSALICARLAGSPYGSRMPDPPPGAGPPDEGRPPAATPGAPPPGQPFPPPGGQAWGVPGPGAGAAGAGWPPPPPQGWGAPPAWGAPQPGAPQGWGAPQPGAPQGWGAPQPGAPQGWGAPPGWGAPAWGAYAPPRTDPKAVWGLVLGILSLV